METKVDTIYKFLILMIRYKEFLSMKIFEKIMFLVLFASMFLMTFSSFFFGVTFFEWTFGLSFAIMTVASLTLSSIELAIGSFPNPYESDEYYID